jgi:fructokinase
VVAVAGEALIDFVPAGRNGLFEAAPGGSPADVAVGLARQEVPVRLLARIADDLLGHRIRAHLTGNRVDLSFAVQAAEPTSLAIVAVGPDGVVEYDFRVKGTADWQWRDHELAGALDGDVVALHAGSLALTMAPGADALQRLMARAGEVMTVSYDPNCRPLLMGAPDAVRGRIEALVGLADVVKASADDLAWLLPGRAPEQVAEAWLSKGPSVVAVTLGPAGLVVAARQTGLLRRPGRRVDVVDTVGAGDACMSGLLAGLHRRGLLGAGAGPTSGPWTPPPWPRWPTRPSWPPPSPAPATAPTHRPLPTCAPPWPSQPARLVTTLASLPRLRSRIRIRIRRRAASTGKLTATLTCWLCGQHQRQVKKQIAGPGVYICNECIDRCVEIIAQERPRA